MHERNEPLVRIVGPNGVSYCVCWGAKMLVWLVQKKRLWEMMMQLWGLVTCFAVINLGIGARMTKLDLTRSRQKLLRSARRRRRRG